MNSRSAHKCLSDREVEDFLFDRLSGTTREAVEEHLLACKACLQKVEAEEEYVRAMRTAARTIESEQLERAYRTPAESKTRPAAWAWPRWGVALGATAAVLALVLVRFQPAASLTETQIALSVERSSGDQWAEAAADQPLRLTPDLAGLPAAELEWMVVDAAGSTAGRERLEPGQGQPVIKLPRGLKAGTYWVRIQTTEGRLLREFALRVR